MNIYVILHFEHRNDVTIIVKLLFRDKSHRRGNRYSSNKCFIDFIKNRTKAAKSGAVCRNTSQVVKLKMHLLQHLLIFQSWNNVTSNAKW